METLTNGVRCLMIARAVLFLAGVVPIGGFSHFRAGNGGEGFVMEGLGEEKEGTGFGM